QFFLGQLGAVEIRDLERTDDVELQYLEIRPDVVGDSRLREINEMRLLAIRATLQLPHDGETLALLVGRLQVVGKIEKAFKKPRLPVETVGGQHRLGASARCGERAERGCANQ